MNVLVACEYSGVVRDAFAARGHFAMSCDLLPTDSPGLHYEGDCFDLDWSMFDLVIAHPPCTALCVSGNRHYAGTAERESERRNSFGACGINLSHDYVSRILSAYSIDYCPICRNRSMFNRGSSVMGKRKRRDFGCADCPHFNRQTLLKDESSESGNCPSADRWKIRSMTYQGIGDAMAEQWGSLC